MRTSLLFPTGSVGSAAAQTRESGRKGRV